MHVGKDSFLSRERPKMNRLQTEQRIREADHYMLIQRYRIAQAVCDQYPSRLHRLTNAVEELLQS